MALSLYDAAERVSHKRDGVAAIRPLLAELTGHQVRIERLRADLRAAQEALEQARITAKLAEDALLQEVREIAVHADLVVFNAALEMEASA